MSVSLFPSTNLTLTDPGSNPGLCGDKPATNCRSHCKAFLRLWGGGGGKAKEMIFKGGGGGGEVKVVFVYSVPRFPKELCSLDGSHASPICPFDNKGTHVRDGQGAVGE